MAQDIIINDLKWTVRDYLLALRDGVDKDELHCLPVPHGGSWRYMVDMALEELAKLDPPFKVGLAPVCATGIHVRRDMEKHCALCGVELLPEDGKAVKTIASANAKQVGGHHYKTKIEHWDYAAANQMDPFQYQITKYITRWKKKGGLQDLEKAQHFLDKYRELIKAGYYAPDPPAGIAE